MHEVTLTVWGRLTNPKGTPTTKTRAEVVSWIQRPRELAADTTKDSLPGFSLARFRDNQRAKVNTIEAHAIVIDDDHGGLEVVDIAAAWKDHAGIVYSTVSHKVTSAKNPDARPRTRTVLWTSRPMTLEEHDRVAEHVRALARGHGQVPDDAAADASRFWFVPAHYVGAPFESAVMTGADLDVDAILAMVPAAPSRTEPARGEGHAPAANRRAFAADMLGRAWAPPGKRHEAQLALAGAMRRDAWPKEEALSFLREVCRVAGDEDPTKREATIDHTWSASDNVIGWSTLAGLMDPVVVDAARALVAPDAAERAAFREVIDSLPGRAPANDAKPPPEPPPKGARRITPAERARRIGARDVKRITTGFPSLDLATRGGILFGKVVVVGGAPGAGKTAVLVRQAYRALESGTPVALLAADEDADALLIRLGQLHGLDRDALENGDPEAREALATWLESVPLIIADGDDDGTTIDVLARELLAIAPTGGVLLVDSLQTARSDEPLSNASDLRSKINANVRAVKRAGKAGHVVFATSELSKAAYKSRDTAENVNALSAFKESGDIEYGVAVALVLVSRSGSSEIVDCSVVKNRLGRRVDFMLRLDHARADVLETTTADVEHTDPLYFLKQRIKAEVGKTTYGRAKSSVADAVGGNRNTVWRAVRELVEAHELTDGRDGLRLPFPGEPGYSASSWSSAA